jgi:hypothetical protein
MSERRVRLLAAGLLRAEVMDRAEGRPRQRHLRLGDRPGDPEVGDLDPAVGADQDVARLDITVDEPAGMRGGEGVRDAGPDPCGLPRRKRTAPAEDRREVLPSTSSMTMYGPLGSSPKS